MNSPPTDTGPPNPQEEKSMKDDKSPTAKEETQNENEKDSGYCDSSSDSLSSEGTPPLTTTTPPAASVTDTVPDPPQAQPVHTHIYILQNVVLKQPRIVLLPPSTRRHRKRAAPSSYLPILRSYPRIAPRQPPPSPAPNPPKETSPPPSKVCKQTPQLLEISMRSLALLRRTRETQRSIRELRAHARLYGRALEGEEGGWERLRKTMETSGGYRKIPPAINLSRTDEAEGPSTSTEEEQSITTSEDSTTSEEEKPEPEEVMTSPGKSVTSESISSESETEGTV